MTQENKILLKPWQGPQVPRPCSALQPACLHAHTWLLRCIKSSDKRRQRRQACIPQEHAPGGTAAALGLAKAFTHASQHCVRSAFNTPSTALFAILQGCRQATGQSEPPHNAHSNTVCSWGRCPFLMTARQVPPRTPCTADTLWRVTPPPTHTHTQYTPTQRNMCAGCRTVSPKGLFC